RNFPFFPRLAEGNVQVGSQGLKFSLEGFPNYVNFGIVRDRLQRDVRRALIDKALSYVALRRRIWLNFSGYLVFLGTAVRRVGEIVVGILRAHDARAGKRQRHPAGIDSDPAAAPLFGKGGCRTGAAGGVQNEVAWVGCHEDATFNN